VADWIETNGVTCFILIQVCEKFFLETHLDYRGPDRCHAVRPDTQLPSLVANMPMHVCFAWGKLSDVVGEVEITSLECIFERFLFWAFT